MSSYEYNQLLKFLYFEGYADSYEEAEYILEDMSDDEFEELIEIRTQKPWSASKIERFKREIERQKKQLEKTPNSSLRPGDQAALKRMIARREQSPTRSASKPDPTPTEKPKGTRTIKKTELASIVKEDFDIITEFLFVEGYADTIESAELMAESISEEWVEEILDEKAEKRMTMVRVHHGTSSDTAEKIKKSGFKGDEVHAATHPNTARGFAKRKSEKTSNVTMLVPKKSIKDQPEKGAKAVKTQGQRGTDALGRKHYSVVMDPEYASKRVVNTTGTVQKPKVPKRFR
jgi:hypothetical protein